MPSLIGSNVVGANWLAFVAALIIGLLVAWWLWGRSSSSADRHRSADALDEGTGPAKRNQALIDAPRDFTSSATSQHAAAVAATGPGIFGGIGELVAAAAASEVTAARDTGEATEAAAPTPAVIPPAAPAATGDDLTRLKGLGPKLSARLAELGVTSYAQIASWSAADIAALDAQLGSFAGRATRDNWVEQAGFLARGDHAGYEARFGKL